MLSAVAAAGHGEALATGPASPGPQAPASGRCCRQLPQRVTARRSLPAQRVRGRRPRRAAGAVGSCRSGSRRGARYRPSESGAAGPGERPVLSAVAAAGHGEALATGPASPGPQAPASGRCCRQLPQRVTARRSLPAQRVRGRRPRRAAGAVGSCRSGSRRGARYRPSESGAAGPGERPVLSAVAAAGHGEALATGPASPGPQAPASGRCCRQLPQRVTARRSLPAQRVRGRRPRRAAGAVGSCRSGSRRGARYRPSESGAAGPGERPVLRPVPQRVPGGPGGSSPRTAFVQLRLSEGSGPDGIVTGEGDGNGPPAGGLGG